MAPTVDVTFVVPNYNGARYLAQTLQSILGQLDPDFIVIVADNRSTDTSVDIARSYRDPRLEVAEADVHLSMAENWDRALSYVRTPYAVLAHADDIYEPNYLSAMLPLIRAHADAFVAHCNVTNIDEQGAVVRELAVERYKRQFFPEEDPYCRPPCEEAAWLRRGNYIVAPSAIYRMDHLRTIGTFDPRYHFVTDWEFWLRGVFAGYRIVGTRQQLVRYRRHSGSLTKAAEANLSRYTEEITILQWLASRGFAAGCYTSDRPDYGLVSNTLMSEFADRLARGDRTGAARLPDFARASIPGFRWSVRDISARAALALGPPAGRTLAWFRDRYLALGSQHESC